MDDTEKKIWISNPDPYGPTEQRLRNLEAELVAEDLRARADKETYAATDGTPVATAR